MESSHESSVRAIGLAYARLDTISGNVANQNTQAYKRKVLIHQATPDFSRALTMQSTEATPSVHLDMRPGALKVTGRSLDIALLPEHYMVVRTSIGNQFIRGGSLQLNAEGLLTTGTGHAVQGSQGDVYLTTADVRIDGEGRIFERDREVSRLSLVQVTSNELMPSLDGSGFVQRNGSTPPNTVFGGVQQGQIEMSNVNMSQEMINMIETVRHAESMHKALQGYEQMMQTAVRALGGL